MDVVIVGAGGHGRVVLDILRAGGVHKPVGFVDADPSLVGTSIDDLPVLGRVNLLPKLKSQKVRGAVIAIGDNRTRKSYAKMLREQGFELVNAVHPSAVVSPTARLGENIVVAAGAILSAGANLEDSVIVNTTAIVDHECQIEEAAHVCPGAALAGRVRIGSLAFIGLGCRVIQCLTVGQQSTVGAGAVVIEDVPDYATVVGVPARVIKVSPPVSTEAFAV